LASRKNFAELVKTTEHRFSSLSFRLLTLIGTYYAIAGGVLKKLKLIIFAGRWHQGAKTLLLYIVGLPE